MGLISDYLEQNRENSNFDICLVLSQCGMSYHSEFSLNRKMKESSRRNQEWQLAFDQQAKTLVKADNYEQQYMSSLYLLNRCIFREKQLLQIQRNYQFITAEVKDTIQEYISLIRNSMSMAQRRITEAKSYIHNTPNLINYDLNENTEAAIVPKILLNSLFYYLSVTAIYDDSHYVQMLFRDISILIKELDPVGSRGKKAKQICSDFYEKQYHPTYGIETCENCGEKLYQQCPHYCFHCFTYQGRGSDI